MDVFALIGGDVSDISSFEDDDDSAAEDEQQDQQSTGVDIGGNVLQDGESSSSDESDRDSDNEDWTHDIVENRQVSQIDQIRRQKWVTTIQSASAIFEEELNGQNELSVEQQIRRLRKQYLELVPIIELSVGWRKIPDWSCDAIVEQLVASLFEQCSDKTLGSFAPPVDYATRAINRLVLDLQQVDRFDFPENLCSCLAANLTRAKSKKTVARGSETKLADKFDYRHLCINNDVQLRLRSCRAFGFGTLFHRNN